MAGYGLGTCIVCHRRAEVAARCRAIVILITPGSGGRIGHRRCGKAACHLHADVMTYDEQSSDYRCPKHDALERIRHTEGGQ